MYIAVQLVGLFFVFFYVQDSYSSNFGLGLLGVAFVFLLTYLSTIYFDYHSTRKNNNKTIEKLLFATITIYQGSIGTILKEPEYLLIIVLYAIWFLAFSEKLQKDYLPIIDKISKVDIYTLQNDDKMFEIQLCFYLSLLVPPFVSLFW